MILYMNNNKLEVHLIVVIKRLQMIIFVKIIVHV
jgi:hypothetical protein